MKKLIRALSLLTAFIIIFSTGAAAQPTPQKTGEFIDEIIDFIEENYIFDVSREALYKAALRQMVNEGKTDFETALWGIFSALDPNSSYIPPDQYKDFMSSITGDIAGIGVNITEMGGRVVVITPIEGTPAHRAGIMPNDIIVSINGEDVTTLGLDEISKRMIGDEGTEVTVGFLRGDKVITHTFVREKIEINPVYHTTLEGKIGYIKISTFNMHVVENVEKALEEFDKESITKIILDLRYNPGGELREVMKLCEIFVPEGPIAHIRYKDERENETYYSQQKNTKYNLAVLINGGSASASELFSGAIKDSKAGKLFGTTSFGKGSIQYIFPLGTGGGIRLSIAEYLTRNKNKIHEIGVVPDVELQNTYEKVDVSGFEEIDFSDEYKEGSEGKGVLAIEQRLSVLGYLISEPDEAYDEETAKAVSQYQIANQFTATGVADFYTLFYLNNEEFDIYYEVDNQLNAAKDYLLEGKLAA